VYCEYLAFLAAFITKYQPSLSTVNHHLSLIKPIFFPPVFIFLTDNDTKHLITSKNLTTNQTYYLMPVYRIHIKPKVTWKKEKEEKMMIYYSSPATFIGSTVPVPAVQVVPVSYYPLSARWSFDAVTSRRPTTT
jgi:hypothetical protein